MISTLSNSELHSRTAEAARNEKNATLRLIEILIEVERRHSYLELGYRSLWNYIEAGLGYSPQQTGERVSAVRLAVKVPDAFSALESGSLSLTTAALVGRALSTGDRTPAEARALFETCVGKPSREVERILLPDDDTPKPDRVRPITKALTRIEIEVDGAFMDLLSRAAELSHEGTVRGVLRHALERFVKSRTPAARKSATPDSFANGAPIAAIDSFERRKPSATQPSATQPSAALTKTTSIEPPSPKRISPTPTPTLTLTPARTPAPEVIPNRGSNVPMHLTPNSRHIPNAVKRGVRACSGDRCEFRSRSSGLRCDGRKYLEFHHADPYAHLGEHSVDNLSHLCRAHHAAVEVRVLKPVRR